MDKSQAMNAASKNEELKDRKARLLKMITEYKKSVSNLALKYANLKEVAQIFKDLDTYLSTIKERVNECNSLSHLDLIYRDFQNHMHNYAEKFFETIIQNVKKVTSGTVILTDLYRIKVRNCSNIFRACKLVNKYFKDIEESYKKETLISSTIKSIVQKYVSNVDKQVQIKIKSLQDECLIRIIVNSEHQPDYYYFQEFEEKLKEYLQFTTMSINDILNIIIENYRTYITKLDFSEPTIKEKAANATVMLKHIIEFLSNVHQTDILIDLTKLDWNTLTFAKLQELFDEKFDFVSSNIYVSKNIPSYYIDGIIMVLDNRNGVVEYVYCGDFRFPVKPCQMSEKKLKLFYIPLNEFVDKGEFIGKTFNRTLPTSAGDDDFIKTEDYFIALYVGPNGALLYSKDIPNFTTIPSKYLEDGNYQLSEVKWPIDLTLYTDKMDVYKEMVDQINHCIKIDKQSRKRIYPESK